MFSFTVQVGEGHLTTLLIGGGDQLGQDNYTKF
jgi:hypothetical protein